MGDLTHRERFWAARAAMGFVTFIFSLASTIALVWMVRRRRDASRWCFTYAKFLGVLFSTYCAIDLCCFIVWIAFSRLARAVKYNGYDQREILAGLLQGRVELSAAARMCDCLVIIFLLVALVSMGNGIVLSRTGSPGKNSRLIKGAADIVSVFIGLLAAAQWGLRIRTYIAYYLKSYDINEGEGMIGLMNIARQLDFGITLITLMSSIAVMWRSVSIYLPTRAGKKIHWPSFCLLLCSSMWLLRSIYDLIYQIRYVDVEDIRDSRDEEDYVPVITMIFYILPGLAIMWTFLGLGIKKAGGLWSTEQPWTNDNPDEGQDIPLEDLHRGDRDTLPPAYSPPPSSASPSAHHQQPTEAWRESPTSTTSPITQPQEVMRPPLPPQSSAAYSMQHHAPTNQSTTSFGSALMVLPTPTRFHNFRRASTRDSPGSVSRPLVIEDAGPAPIGLSPVSPDANAMPQAISPLSDDGILFATPPEEPPHSQKQGLSDDSSAEYNQLGPMGYSYNTGLVSPVSPIDAGPADGFYQQGSPPSHDEAMGLNHQADGFRPQTSSLQNDETMATNHQADGFYRPASPPAHDEAMGLNHQADGRTPSTPLPYPTDKK